jgi:hypothetical protein
MQWCKLLVFTSKREDFNLMFTNHGKEDGIYPLKKDNKAQNKDQRSIVIGVCYMSPFQKYILANLGLFSLIRFVTLFTHLW